MGHPSRVEGDIRSVCFPLSSSVNQADPSQGDVQFMAVEVVRGCYLFRPVRGGGRGEGRKGESWISMVERKGKRTAEPPEDDDDTTDPVVALGAGQTFRYNPIHDYESVWWVAVWFVFCCRHKGAIDDETDDKMERARNAVYQDREIAFCGGYIEDACLLLPTTLQPLGTVLVGMRETLVNAYMAFEGSFDGSKILSVHKKLEPQLFRLLQRARDLVVEPPTQS